MNRQNLGIILSIHILCLCLGQTPAYCAKKEVELEPIVVKRALYQAEEITTKDINIIVADGEELKPIDLTLDYTNEVDVARRGIYDIQADISIRGSTPEQTLVSINGINANNPQTAHHNLDTGLPASLLEYIESSKASSPLSWAQGAMGGAINMVTKRPSADETNAAFSFGSDTTQKSSLSLTRRNNIMGFGFWIDESTSDGFRFDTEYKEFSLAPQWMFKADKAGAEILFAYGEKEFGAADFYGPYNSKEWTRSVLFNPSARVEIASFLLSPKFLFQRHYDKYMLDVTRPDYYINHHMTDLGTLQLDAKRGLGTLGDFLFTGGYTEERIKSTRLGNNSRDKSFFSCAVNNFQNIIGYDLGLLVNTYSDYDTEILPQAGVSFKMSEMLNLRSNFSKASRPPTYTELYYDSPASKGNPDIGPEYAYNYEAGIDITVKDDIKISCNIFRRDSDNLIDWVKDSAAQSYYRAMNITKVNTEGLEADMRFNVLDTLNITAGYAYTDSDIEKDYNYISKYALTYPNHKVTFKAQLAMPFGKQEFSFIYKDRKEYTHYLLAQCSFNYDLPKGVTAFLNIDNLFNSAIEDIKGCRLAGRQIETGLKLKF